MAAILVSSALTPPGSARAETLEIVVVSASDEERVNAGQSFAGIVVETHRPVLRAVELALHESSALLDALGIEAELHRLELGPDDDVRARLAKTSPASLLVLDLPRARMEQVARVADELERVAVNVRHSDEGLRETLCLRHLLHAIPSDRMYFDALAQFLVYRGWRKVLVVRGPSAQDTDRARTLVRSLEKFGTSVEDERVFTLSHHPDDRDENRPEFLTGGVSYDVVAVIDSARDYGRYLQHSTRSPRPVVGDVGLGPVSWHFALERYGAPQLNERYRQFGTGTPMGPREAMTDAEFAAWSAVKLLVNSINTRADGAALDARAVLEDPASQVDLYKGTRGSVRRWNNQLRQPILLATADAVIAIAPMPKFLHPEHYVDTLGVDEPESECRLR